MDEFLRISDLRSPFAHQGYAYVTPFDAIQHMAFVHGRIGDGKDMLARLHRADIIRDVFGGAHPIHSALQRFKQEGRGVIVFLRDGAAGVPTHAIPQAGSTGSEVARSRQWREPACGMACVGTPAAAGDSGCEAYTAIAWGVD